MTSSTPLGEKPGASLTKTGVRSDVGFFVFQSDIIFISAKFMAIKFMNIKIEL